MPYTYNPIQGRGERLHSSSPITHLHKQFITHTLQNQSREQRHSLPLWLSGFFQRMKHACCYRAITTICDPRFNTIIHVKI